MQGLIHVLDEHNGLVRLFRNARDRCIAGEIPAFKIRLYNMSGVRGYELPTADLLRGIVFEDGPRSRTDFDVIIKFRGGPPQRISKLHQSYMSLQFPLLFVFGQPWFYPELQLKPRDGRGKGKKVTMNVYYRYQLHPRMKDFGLIFRSGRFFQQYMVTVGFRVRLKIATPSLDYIRTHQNDLRSDYLSGLYDVISRGDHEGIAAGSKIYYREHLPEGPPGIKRYMVQYPDLKPADRADVIDNYISAEIPDSVQDPRGYKLVTELMMHGPCGAANSSAACMQEGSCSRHFPKTYNDRTFFDSNGHTHYRRRDTGVHVMKGESKLDNCDVVPYNRALCLAFEAHINVEYCGWSMLIKYLFKYISKGPDRILAKINNSDESTTTGNKPHIDEIQNYVDGRFICPYEACWRIFYFPIHSREPTVQILNVHLENMQCVNFRESDRLDIIVNLPEKKQTTLTEWFVYNNENTDGQHLTYLDFPSEFVWYANSKQWQRRQIRTKKSIGRLTYVHPSSGDLFYFRMLLCHRKGCKSPIDVRTVNGQILPNYRAACEALGLLGDDKEWDTALEESTVSATSKELRILFSQILIYCDVADPLKLWTKYWEAMGDDVPAKISNKTKIPNFHVNTEELQGYILYELEKILNGFGKSVTEFGLHPPPQHLLRDLENKLLMEEKNYKRDLLREEATESVPKLNHDQRKIFDLIISASTANKQELLFVYGHGGTGKTFLFDNNNKFTSIPWEKLFWRVLLFVRHCIPTSASRTHSPFPFKLPLELTDESLCPRQKKKSS
ncbi:DNA helicase [Tanacetum coccineum]